MGIPVRLSDQDQGRLDGRGGAAAEWAMRLLKGAAESAGAARLVDVTQAHLVGCYHSGPANLRLISWLVEAGATVVIPTTLNASAADLLQPRLRSGDDDDDFRGNSEVVRLYDAMGCRMALTCAPYHLPQRPKKGENVAWAESNAVVFANSVMGARTNMTYQYLDLAAALTGRIPETGLYLDDRRAGRFVYHLDSIPGHWLEDDALYPLLGLVLGRASGTAIPVVANLPASVTEDQLRSLGAAAAAAGQVAMFHAVGITPEAPTLHAALHDRPPAREISVSAGDILKARDLLGVGQDASIVAVCLGAPHFSIGEFRQLLGALAGRRVSPSIRLVVSTSRYVREELVRGGMLPRLVEAGVELVVDTCTYYGRALGVERGCTVMTNSAKWAYYAPGNLGVRAIFARLVDCVETAVKGEMTIDDSFWSE
jgi:predicted aconitase